MGRLDLLIWIHRHRLPHRVRGMWRAAAWLAKDFRSHPIAVHRNSLIYTDLSFLDGHAFALLDGTHEGGEQALLRHLLRPGDTAFDIGANLGLYTTLFAEQVGPEGKVIAIEPNPRLADNLRHTTAAIPQAEYRQCALAAEPGEMSFFIPRDDHMLGSLANWSGQKADEVRCRVEVLDEIAKKYPPDLIKIDVEGAEYLVLQGAQELFSDPSRSPIVFFEQIPAAAAAFGYPAESAQQWLRERPETELYRIAADGTLERQTSLYREAANMLLVPAARKERLDGWPVRQSNVTSAARSV